MGELRWPTVEASGGRGGQTALFDADELADHHVGSGEFRGMEFLHVRARSIINRIPPAAHLPFSHTINVYRGCSHACSYCLAGDTPVLLADGCTRAIADLRRGDVVCGTEPTGAEDPGGLRRCVQSEVLDHWSTVRAAYRVRLVDGTTVVASGDHRFLTNRGWRHVTGGVTGAGLRPHLVAGDVLVRVGAAESGVGRRADLVSRRTEWALSAVAPAGGAPRPTGSPSLGLTLARPSLGSRVAAIEPLGAEIPMYDITTATGDFVASGMVSHNCFARPTHDYLGLGIGEDFERKIVVKTNAVELLRTELAAKRWQGHHIAMGTNTDPYQRCEGKYHLTQGVIQVLTEQANPFSILTKSTLILRDLDLLVEAARRADVRVNLSIGTLDEEVWRLTEPGTPAPRQRVAAVRRLREAGLDCGVLVAPVLPGLSDRPGQLEEVIDACVAAGATSISAVPLHLRPGLRDHYLDWLERARPELLDDHRRRYTRAYLPAQDRKDLATLVRTLVDTARARQRRETGGQWRDAGQARLVEGSFTRRLREQMGGDAVAAAAPAEPEVEQLGLL